MECRVNKLSLRTFASTVQCLGKIGKEVFLEACADRLTLRALNDTHSAFAAFTFYDTFFDVFKPPPGDAVIKCKFFVKASQNVFRSTRNVESLSISFADDGVNHVIVFRLECKFGIVRTHRLVFEDCEIYQAVVDRDACPNRITSRPRTLGQVVNHIRGTDEVSFIVSADQLLVTSFDQNLSDEVVRHVLKTALDVSPHEFEQFTFGSTGVVDVTFALREFKALLSLCDAVGAEELSMFFHGRGQPVLFSTAGLSNPEFSADLVLATVQDTLSESQTSYLTAASKAKSRAASAHTARGGGGGGVGARAHSRATPRPAPAPSHTPRSHGAHRHMSGGAGGGAGAGAGAGAGVAATTHVSSTASSLRQKRASPHWASDAQSTPQHSVASTSVYSPSKRQRTAAPSSASASASAGVAGSMADDMWEDASGASSRDVGGARLHDGGGAHDSGEFIAASQAMTADDPVDELDMV